MHQLFHTTCPDNRGFNRAPGFGVLAASCASEREIPPQVKEIAPYPFALIRAGTALPVRWVWQNTTNGTSMLVHCVYLGGAQSGRVGTHFSHILFDIPPDKGLREILGACAFPFWKRASEGPINLAKVYNLPPGSLPSDSEVSQRFAPQPEEVETAELSTEPESGKRVQHLEWMRLCEVALAVCLEFDQPDSQKQVALPSENDAVLKLLQFLVRVLPSRMSRELTFSSLEQRDGGVLRIVGLPREYLNQLTPSSSTANLNAPDQVWNALRPSSRGYASWCLNQAAANDWSQIDHVLQLAEQCEVNSGARLTTIWKFCTAPEALGRDEVEVIVHQQDLAALAFERPEFRRRALQCAVEDPLDSQLLRRLHAQEKTSRPSRKTAVEEELIQAAVLAAEADQLTRLRSIIEELRWFHRVISDNRDFGILSAGFGERLREILSRLNQRLLSRTERQPPSVDVRLELFSHGRQWLADESKGTSLEHWLTAKNEVECLELLRFLERERYSETTQNLLVQALASYLRTVSQDLTAQPRLLDWIGNCPAKVLAHALSHVNAAQAEWLAVIWNNIGFRQDEFFAVTLPRLNPPHFESVYDIARVELLPETIRHLIREGDRPSLMRVTGLRDADVVQVANSELRRELFRPADEFDDQVANRVKLILNGYNPRNFSSFLFTLNEKWRELTPPAAAWICEQCRVDQHLDMVQISTWIEMLHDATLSNLVHMVNDEVRVRVAYTCLQRELPPQLLHFDPVTYRLLLEQIAETINSSSATGQEIDVSNEVGRAIHGLVRDTAPQFLVEPQVLETLIQLASKYVEFLPLLESSLTNASEEVLSEQFQVSEQKSRWENVLRLVAKNSNDYLNTVRAFVAKLIFVEISNPWFRINNTLGLQQHLNYSAQEDCLTRRSVAARFLVSEDGLDVPTFPELLLSLKQEEPRFQDAFFRALRQSGDATYARLLKPFQDASLDRAISNLDRRFDELYHLWQNVFDYQKMISHFVMTDQNLFREPRAVAAALFPVVRYAAEFAVDDSRKLAEQLIRTWSRQAPARSPDETYWQLRECTADLDPESKSQFLDLCGQSIQAIKHELGPDQAKPTSRSWFGIRRIDQ